MADCAPFGAPKQALQPLLPLATETSISSAARFSTKMFSTSWVQSLVLHGPPVIRKREKEEEEERKAAVAAAAAAAAAVVVDCRYG